MLCAIQIWLRKCIRKNSRKVRVTEVTPSIETANPAIRLGAPNCDEGISLHLSFSSTNGVPESRIGTAIIEEILGKTTQPVEKNSPAPSLRAQSRPSPIPQSEAGPVGYLSGLAAAINNSPVVQAQKKLAEELQNGYANVEASPVENAEDGTVQRMAMETAVQPESPGFEPIQLMNFDRFLGRFSLTRNSEEDALLAQEAAMKEFLTEMRPYERTDYGGQILAIKAQFEVIEGGTITEQDYTRTRATLTRLRNRLDEISTLIARRTVELERMIEEAVNALPPIMATDKNKQVVRETIYPDLAYGPIHDQDVSNQTLAFARIRIQMFRRNVTKVTGRINTDWATILDTFHIGGRLRFLHLTGSDFHNEGQSVVIIETTTGAKVVYKPRDLTPDIRLAGDGGTLHDISEDLDDAFPAVATSTFHQMADHTGERYGYMEYQQKVDRLTVAQARDYYFQMGQMAVTTKLLGVTDLHQDNILTGEDGKPLIIDAEASFLPDIMMSDAWDSTLIGDALKSFDNETKLTVNYFLTEPEWDEWEERQHEEGATLLGFVTRKRAQSVKAGGAYHDDFKRGVTALLTFISANEQAVTEYVQGRVNAVTNVRIVPMKTSDFKGLMSTYNRLPDRRQEVLEDTCGYVRVFFTRQGYELSGSFNIDVTAGLAHDFTRTDIPIFHYEPADDRVYYRGRAVATHRPGIQVAIARNVHWITQSTVDDVVAGLGLQ